MVLFVCDVKIEKCKVESRVRDSHGKIRQRRAAGGESKRRLQYGGENPKSSQIEEVRLSQVIELVTIRHKCRRARWKIDASRQF